MAATMDTQAELEAPEIIPEQEEEEGGKEREPAENPRRFIRVLKDLPLLSRDEEVQLAQQYRDTKDPALARRLVESHLRLVVKIARQCCSRQSLLPDLIQEGCLGLIRAVEKYDPDRGIRLSSYAAWWIRAYI